MSLYCCGSNELTLLQEFCQLTVRWTIHKLPGLSDKDIAMAELSEKEADLIGTVAPRRRAAAWSSLMQIGKEFEGCKRQKLALSVSSSLLNSIVMW
jgi:hypothetical protein